MNKRRSIIATFLIVALLTVGIGYAALSDTLSVTGSASFAQADAIKTFDGDIYFSKALGDPSRVTATIDPADKDKATITVLDSILKEVGDEVIVTLTIESESDLDVQITPTVSNAEGGSVNTEYFSVTTGAAQTLVAGGTLDYTITIRLIKTNATDADITSNFVVTFQAQSV
jgi:hypothetical protein